MFSTIAVKGCLDKKEQQADSPLLFLVSIITSLKKR